MIEHPGTDVPTTDDDTVDSTQPRRTTSRTLIASVIAVALLFGGATFFAYDGQRDCDDAQRERRAATLDVRDQRVDTLAAEQANRKARADARETAQALDIVSDSATQFGLLTNQELDADRALQAAGMNQAPVEEYNAAVARSNAIVDLYQAAALDLIDQIKRLQPAVPS